MFGFFRKKEQAKEKPYVGKLCECSGDITTRNNKECEYFPLQNGYHTSFSVGECIHCGGLRGFPHYNLQLAVNEGTEESKSILKQLGYKW